MTFQKSPNELRFPAALTKCFFCQGDNEVLISQRGTHRVEGQHRVDKMHGMVVNQRPCNQCRSYMKVGVIVVTVDLEKTDDWKNPWRTGGWFVVRDKVLEQLAAISDEGGKKMIADALKKRAIFIEDDVARFMGLSGDKPVYASGDEFNVGQGG